MDLDDLLGPNPVVVDLRANTRWGAIDELVAKLVAAKKIMPEDGNSIAEAIRAREASMTTGIGYGIGLPHASTDLVTKVVAAIGRSRDGIQFDALDGQPVKLVLLFLVPKRRFQECTQALADLAKLIHGDDFRNGFWRRFE